MARLFPISMLLLLMGLAFAANALASDARPLSLSRDNVTVTGDTVRLGDLFSNTGNKADRVVDSAPGPGDQAVYDVHRLAAIAGAHGLTWRARSWSERVVIERPGKTIGTDQVMRALRHALETHATLDGPMEIEVTKDDLGVKLPADSPATVGIENLRLNPGNGQFTATVAAPAGDPAAIRMSVAGRLYHLIEIPTLNRRIKPGTVITESDITWMRMRTERVSRNVITDSGNLVGYTPTRPAVAGKMLRMGDVRAPVIVGKGSIVTLFLRAPNLVLTAKGRAMEDGARGDVIRVMNTQSKTIIEGEVTSSGAVSVSVTSFMPGQPATNQSAANLPARR